MYYKILRDKINKKTATVAIIGLGYVGLPLLVQFYRKGFKCIGLDLNKKKIKSFTKKKFNNDYFGSILKKKNKHSNSELYQIKFTSEYSTLSKADCIIICLPTPITKTKKPDLSKIYVSLKSMGKYLKKGQLISLESTVAPGTTERVYGKFLIKKKGFDLSSNFFLAYSPERENPVIQNLGQRYNFYNTPKVCAGYSRNCTNLATLLYSCAIKKVVKSYSLKSAEMSKMIENVYRSVNIGLVNELKMMSHKMSINIHEILNLAETKPFGFTKFKPGPGIGGHCIPIDPYYLIWEAKKNNFNSEFLKNAVKTNEKVTNWCLRKIKNIFKKNRLVLKKQKILLLGVAYKSNIDDLRESPALKFFEYFKKNLINFDYCDPYINYIKKIKKKSINLNYKLFNKYSAIVLITDHKIFDKKKILKNSNLIVDTRGYFSKYTNDKIYFV